MTPDKTKTGMPYQRLDDTDCVRLEPWPGIYIEVRKLGKALDVRTLPYNLTVHPVDACRVLIRTEKP